MFVLLMVVVFAVFALRMSHMERKRPAVLVLLGLMSVALGGRTFALLSDSYSDEYLGAVYAGEEPPANTLPQSGGELVLGEVGSESEMAETATARDGAKIGSADKEPHQLAVEPKLGFRYLTIPRPDWVETEAVKGKDCYQIAVESGLHVRKRAAQHSLQDEVRSVVDAYVNDYLGSNLASKLSGYSIEEADSGAARTINLRLDGRTHEIARERFDEQIEFDYGVMNQSHALVKIDQDLNQSLDEHWNKVRAAARLFQTGLGAGAILLLLGTMFSYLKLDTATRGYYTGRLQFGAAAAILAIIAAGVVCANWIPWM